MNSGIYQIRNLIDDKVYVGSAKDFNIRKLRHFNALVNGKHHSIKLQRAVEKHGIENFVFEHIESVPYQKDIIVNREQYWIDTLNSKKVGYNIADASYGDILSTHPNREEIIKKISKTLRQTLNQMSVCDRKDRWSKVGVKNGMYGKTHNKETVKRANDIRRDKYYSDPDWIARISNIHKKKFEDRPELRDTISKSAKGRLGVKNPFYGKQHTDETKAKISASRKGIKPSNTRRVKANGIEFDSITECANHFGVSKALVLYRIKSDKHDVSYI